MNLATQNMEHTCINFVIIVQFFNINLFTSLVIELLLLILLVCR